MNAFEFDFSGLRLSALGSGALWCPEEATLCVSDLHLGKSGRILRRSGVAVPPYETQETLERLSEDIDRTGARRVICLGDSFDDVIAANDLSEDEHLWISRLQAGREWIWVEGNHDPGPAGPGGTHLSEFRLPPLTFRHIADPGSSGEISGHYHPAARVRTRARRITRPAFLVDEFRIILPAYGTYTGGLGSETPVLSALMADGALAILTGVVPLAVAMPRG